LLFSDILQPLKEGRVFSFVRSVSLPQEHILISLSTNWFPFRDFLSSSFPGVMKKESPYQVTRRKVMLAMGAR